ncbi:MAG: tetratricopeptide repeat protein, partial [Planctomycetes bacterium]|nr:tetratricopeptide repeat protein [Planctomycetota bacterium]
GAWAELAGAVDGFDGPQWQRALVSADAALLALGDLAGADDSIREARAWIELARARALDRTADGRRILSAIERGLTIDPEGPHLLAEHGWILWKADPSGTRVEERALEDLRAAVAAAPRFILAHARLAEILLASGRVGEARKEVETLAGLAPDHPDLPRLRRDLEE